MLKSVELPESNSQYSRLSKVNKNGLEHFDRDF